VVPAGRVAAEEDDTDDDDAVSMMRRTREGCLAGRKDPPGLGYTDARAARRDARLCDVRVDGVKRREIKVRPAEFTSRLRMMERTTHK